MIKAKIFPDHIVNTYGNTPRVNHLDSGSVIVQEGDYKKELLWLIRSSLVFFFGVLGTFIFLIPSIIKMQQDFKEEIEDQIRISC